MDMYGHSLVVESRSTGGGVVVVMVWSGQKF